jgi:hypothetical protein
MRAGSTAVGGPANICMAWAGKPKRHRFLCQESAAISLLVLETKVEEGKAAVNRQFPTQPVTLYPDSMRARSNSRWRALLYRCTAGLVALVLCALWAAPLAAALQTNASQPGMSCCRKNRNCCCKKQRAGNTGPSLSVPAACGKRCPGILVSGSTILFFTSRSTAPHRAAAASELLRAGSAGAHQTLLTPALHERPPPAPLIRIHEPLGEL